MTKKESRDLAMAECSADGEAQEEAVECSRRGELWDWPSQSCVRPRMQCAQQVIRHYTATELLNYTNNAFCRLFSSI